MVSSPEKIFYESHGVAVPIEPLGVWFDGCDLIIDWLQPWKNKSLSPLQRAIFYTILKHRLFIGDYHTAKFRFIDLRAPEIGQPRALDIQTDAQFDTLSTEALGREFEKLARALDRYAEMPKKPREEGDEKEEPALLALMEPK